MAIESKPNIGKAGIEEKKIYRSLAKLRRFPKVQEIFKVSAQLFRDRKISDISEISKNKEIRVFSLLPNKNSFTMSNITIDKTFIII